MDSMKASPSIQYLAMDPNSKYDISVFKDLATRISSDFLNNHIDSIVGGRSNSIDLIFSDAEKCKANKVAVIEIIDYETVTIISPHRKIEFKVTFYDVSTRKQCYSMKIAGGCYGFSGKPVGECVDSDIRNAVFKYSEMLIRGLI